MEHPFPEVIESVQTGASDVEFHAGATTVNAAADPHATISQLEQLFQLETVSRPAHPAFLAPTPGSNAVATPEAHHQVINALYLEELARLPVLSLLVSIFIAS